MSKEEIVHGIWADVEWGHPEIAVEKLDTYAQEIAVGFAEYINEGIWAKYESGLWYPFEPQDDDKGLTTPQLYQQFITNKNEKK